MSGLWYFWGSLALLLGGYFVYGAFVEKVFGADFGRLTPVKSRRDGVDYIGVGPLFATTTKTDVCAPVTLDYLDSAAQT